jgi:ribonuclease HII
MCPTALTELPTLTLEAALRARGFTCVAGVDEVGRGAWAGPLVAAAVVLPSWSALPPELADLRDSKLLTPLARERVEAELRRAARAVAVGIVAPSELDALGLAAAGRLAMCRAVGALELEPDYLLVDAFELPELAIPQRAIVQGDRLVASIAAASVVAKVYRDRLLRALGGLEPRYSFAAHKGYGTPEHQAALDRHGPCVHHRWSYEPVRRAWLVTDGPHG